MRALLAIIVSFLLTGCPSASESGLRAVPMPLDPADAQARDLGRTQVLSLLRLSAPQSWFGGISGVAWDGDHLMAVSDTGSWLRFRVEADGQGAAVGVSDLSGGPLHAAGPGKEDGDAEELVATPDGWLVSFERHHRLWLYPQGLERPPVALDAPAGMLTLPDNEGVEAAARLADGRLLLIAEGRGEETGNAAWIGTPGRWQRLEYARHGLFRPTAAAPLPDGAVLVVERRYTPMGGPAMRLVRLEPQSLSGPVLRGEELAVLAPPLTVDNFEALAVRPRADGRLVATILTDDNFSPLQSTLMLTLLLP